MLLFALVGSLFGLIFGSAINAIVWRIHAGTSWVHGRSQCSDCGHTLAVIDLVPVISWLVLRGRCRYCKARIKDHPVVELATAILFGLSAYVIAPVNVVGGIRLGLWLVILVLLIILAVYDARWLELPNKIMYPTIGAAAVMVGFEGLVAHDLRVVAGSVIAAVLGGGMFYMIVALSRGKAMGGGDIKLAFAMGLVLGVKSLAVAMMVAFNAGAILGIALLILRKRGRRDQIPFGPFLVLGTVVAYLYGRNIVAWYLHLNGLT